MGEFGVAILRIIKFGFNLRIADVQKIQNGSGWQVGADLHFLNSTKRKTVWQIETLPPIKSNSVATASTFLKEELCRIDTRNDTQMNPANPLHISA